MNAAGKEEEEGNGEEEIERTEKKLKEKNREQGMNLLRKHSQKRIIKNVRPGIFSARSCIGHWSFL